MAEHRHIFLFLKCFSFFLPSHRKLEFLAETRLRNAELITVLRDSPSCDLIALFRHPFHQFIICQRLVLVLIVDTFLKCLLEFPSGYFLAILILKTFREEILQRIYTEMCFDILAVYDS